MSFCDEHGTSDGCPDCITLGLEEEIAKLREALSKILNSTYELYDAHVIAKEALNNG